MNTEESRQRAAETKRARTRMAILKAIAILAARDDRDGPFSLQEILAEAKVGSATFYSHFESIQAAVDATLEDKIEFLKELSKPLFEKNPTILTVRIAYRLYDLACTYPAMFRYFRSQRQTDLFADVLFMAQWRQLIGSPTHGGLTDHPLRPFLPGLATYHAAGIIELSLQPERNTQFEKKVITLLVDPKRLNVSVDKINASVDKKSASTPAARARLGFPPDLY